MLMLNAMCHRLSPLITAVNFRSVLETRINSSVEAKVLTPTMRKEREGRDKILYEQQMGNK